MRVLKNLFGRSDTKIDAGEIVVNNKLLPDALNNIIALKTQPAYRINNNTPPSEVLLEGEAFKIDFINDFNGITNSFKTVVTLRGYYMVRGTVQLAFDYNLTSGARPIYLRYQNFDIDEWRPWIRIPTEVI